MIDTCLWYKHQSWCLLLRLLVWMHQTNQLDFPLREELLSPFHSSFLFFDLECRLLLCCLESPPSKEATPKEGWCVCVFGRVCCEVDGNVSLPFIVPSLLKKSMSPTCELLCLHEVVKEMGPFETFSLELLDSFSCAAIVVVSFIPVSCFLLPYKCLSRMGEHNIPADSFHAFHFPSKCPQISRIFTFSSLLPWWLANSQSLLVHSVRQPLLQFWNIFAIGAYSWFVTGNLFNHLHQGLQKCFPFPFHEGDYENSFSWYPEIQFLFIILMTVVLKDNPPPAPLLMCDDKLKSRPDAVCRLCHKTSNKDGVYVSSLCRLREFITPILTWRKRYLMWWRPIRGSVLTARLVSLVWNLLKKRTWCSATSVIAVTTISVLALSPFQVENGSVVFVPSAPFVVQLNHLSKKRQLLLLAKYRKKKVQEKVQQL